MSTLGNAGPFLTLVYNIYILGIQGASGPSSISIVNIFSLCIHCKKKSSRILYKNFCGSSKFMKIEFCWRVANFWNFHKPFLDNFSNSTGNGTFIAISALSVKNKHFLLISRQTKINCSLDWNLTFFQLWFL